jgi:hypothetical protein
VDETLGLLNQGMKFDVLKSQTLILSTSGAPLREINHPAFMQPRNFIFMECGQLQQYSNKLDKILSLCLMD